MPRDKVFLPGPGRIFVFGSNESGVHGAGAALTAYEQYGAEWYHAEGLQGSSYGIPTKDKTVAHTLPLEQVKVYIDRFIEFAYAHPEMHFFVTRIGCGLAGFTDEEMTPLFIGAPSNCDLPHGWR
jgi:hypothetical protein